MKTAFPPRPMTIATEPASVAAYLIQEASLKVCGWTRDTVELADGTDIEVRVGVCVVNGRRFRNLADLAAYCTV